MATPQTQPALTLQVRRTFQAPREKVFAAWAQREQLEKWMCRDIPSHKIIHHQQDIRTGGHWRMEIHDPAKNEVYWGQGIYREVTPPEKIVFTWRWTKDTPDGKNLHPGSEDTLVTVEFFALGNATELVLTHAVFSSIELRDDHNRGWNGCFDALEKLLSAKPASAGSRGSPLRKLVSVGTFVAATELFCASAFDACISQVMSRQCPPAAGGAKLAVNQIPLFQRHFDRRLPYQYLTADFSCRASENCLCNIRCNCLYRSPTAGGCGREEKLSRFL